MALRTTLVVKACFLERLVPATRYLQNQCTALTMTGQARSDDRAAVFMAGAAQDVGQLHGVGAKGTDDKELFANCGGGRHAAFLDDERSVLFRTCGAVSPIGGAR
ncbi:hypothetical protein A245_29268 [Pseudomonas syringae pv. actinidiae ICMP 19096]|uniref:Uncharacterized protein n=1 Tax=Pseudomonas syringae pv. actinidiae ICMP 19096 TaxID=1194405 RepID=A0A656JSH0_PSESF|nr:hypothetical protein A245_29268 [Pseudomonas syringae pv. actinidiae ICMP 19096]